MKPLLVDGQGRTLVMSEADRNEAVLVECFGVLNYIQIGEGEWKSEEEQEEAYQALATSILLTLGAEKLEALMRARWPGLRQRPVLVEETEEPPRSDPEPSTERSTPASS